MPNGFIVRLRNDGGVARVSGRWFVDGAVGRVEGGALSRVGARVKWEWFD